MNIKETCDKLALIGLRGSVQGTGSADYTRIFVIDARNVTLGRITIYKGVYDHIKWYDGIIQAYDVDQRRPTMAWDLLLQHGKVLTDEMWSSIKISAQHLQEQEIERLKQWRRDNPAKLDHNGIEKRRRAIKGPSLMKCIRLMMGLVGAY